MIEALVSDLVDANHILYSEGIVDAFGHVSARHPTRADRFLIACSKAPALVGAGDIVELDLDGNAAPGDTRRLYLERYIHGEIYRARPDVHAVVHSHSAAVLPFAAVRTRTLRPLCHMSGFLGAGAPLFEIRDFAGAGSDHLIRSRELGAALARTLGEHAVVLMRGHGSTAVAPTLERAVYRAIYCEVNARVQLEAERLGDVVFLDADEGRACDEANSTQIERPWQLWKARARDAVARAAQADARDAVARAAPGGIDR